MAKILSSLDDVRLERMGVPEVIGGTDAHTMLKFSHAEGGRDLSIDIMPDKNCFSAITPSSFEILTDSSWGVTTPEKGLAEFAIFFKGKIVTQVVHPIMHTTHSHSSPAAYQRTSQRRAPVTQCRR